MRARRSLPHLIFVLAGLAIALIVVLPVRTSETSCPPPGDGRNLCLLEQAWAPAITTVALCVALAWMLAEALFVRWPRLRAGERERRRRPRHHGRDALMRDGTLRAATWGRLPPPRRRAGRPRITVSAIAGGPPEVRALGPLDHPRPPAGHSLRVVAGRGRHVDQEVLAAAWETATRRSAELIDRVAAELGLAAEGLAPARADDPDPLLSAATWSRRPA
ncbi:MAG: hypothetical protein IRZ32_08130 [Solirubrobacteraceae bacterium]|nr:hypothetical protein [Solirubrobacteraceae bacterium]